MLMVEQINAEINNLRKVLYFIENATFKALYKDAIEQQRTQVDEFIKLRDLAKLKEWIDNQRALNLDTMTLLDLRMTARGVGITKVERFTKTQLMSLIIDRRKRDSR